MILSKIAQAGLFVISYILFWWAQVTENYVGPFSEAAKYGFAVLFMLIVLYLLYKDYRHEKNYNRELNQLIQKMVDDNRAALDQSSEALEKQSKSNDRLVVAIENLSRS